MFYQHTVKTIIKTAAATTTTTTTIRFNGNFHFAILPIAVLPSGVSIFSALYKAEDFFSSLYEAV